jgi:hypothetical protein
VVYSKGAVADDADAGGAVKSVFEVDRRFVAHRGLGDDVSDSRHVPGHQRPETAALGQSLQVHDPGRLEDLKVNSVVDVSVGVEVLVTNGDHLHHGRVLQWCLFSLLGFPVSDSTIRGSLSGLIRPDGGVRRTSGEG